MRDEDFDYFGDSYGVDEAFEEIKDSLKKHVSQEIKDEIEKLRSENKRLREVNADLDKIRMNWESEKRKLEMEYKEKERQLFKRPIEELIEFIKQPYYTPYSTYDYVEKCDKCNEDRKIELTDVYGRKHLVDCVCNKRIPMPYVPEEEIINYISGIHMPYASDYDKKFRMYVKFNVQPNDDFGFIDGKFFDPDNIVKTFEDGVKRYEKSNKNNWFGSYYFVSKEECQKFCDYLNELGAYVR